MKKIFLQISSQFCKISFTPLPKKFSFQFYSPFCVTAKVTKLIGLSPPLFLSPTNLVTFAGTQNGE
jgi:hypothetical protein